MTQYAPPPPTPYLEQPPTRWPRIIGIISIVLASLGLVCGGGGMVLNQALPGLFSGRAGAQANLPSGMNTWQLVGGLVGLVLNGLLLAAGVLLTKRRLAGSSLHVVYSILTIVLAIANAIMTYALMGAIIANSIPRGNAVTPEMQAQATAMAKMIGTVSLVLGLVFACAYPVFLLIWFNRKAIKAEVATWSAPGAPRT